MELKQWLSSTGTTYRQFGDAIGVSEHAVWRYASGRRIPDREVMPRIHAVTDGLVTANDFYGPPSQNGNSGEARP